MKNYLPDVNVWIALTFDAHSHHQTARVWLEANGAGSIGFCRTTQQGFLRIATNRKAMGDDVITLPQAWQAYDALQQDARIEFFDEPLNVESYWRSFTANENFSPKIWTDAYLAAFACAADLNLVTFDRGFGRYPDLQTTLLSH
ncbi:MAG: PIN domain-containing protein [Planctomycetales bacterium]|nr:PIN domain-containing protein [Planctomycetales bacterium]MCA9197162.1 PIN domain-containing protein [Planctomycetales bacterium]